MNYAMSLDVNSQVIVNFANSSLGNSGNENKNHRQFQGYNANREGHLRDKARG